MIAVILQPSYIPWRGYFDQIRRADLFIFYDDVQYDKHGWRNRNQIKTAHGKKWLTVPVHSGGVTQGISIKDVRIDWTKPWPQQHFRSLTSSYNRAPFFKRYLPLLESMYDRRDESIADFTIETTIALARQLGIRAYAFPAVFRDRRNYRRKDRSPDPDPEESRSRPLYQRACSPRLY